MSAWLISGASVPQITAYGTNLPNSGWTPIDIKDVSGDGRADLLWYNKNTGSVYAWLINGGSAFNGPTYGALSSIAGWSPLGLDDFNGDGRIDMFWFNTYTNATTTWLLNGIGILQTANYGSVTPPSVWQVKIPGG